MLWKEWVAEAVSDLLSALLRPVGPNFCNHVGRRIIQSVPVKLEGLDIRIHAPEFATPDPNDSDLFERIQTSFHLAKQDQPSSDAVCLPSSLWQHQLDKSYSALHEGKDRFSFFLANFAAWDRYTGIEYTDLIHQCRRSGKTRRLYERHLLPVYLKQWLDYESNGRPVQNLWRPPIGNPWGMLVNDDPIPLSAVSDDVHGNLIQAWLPDDEEAFVSEIGPGFGGLIRSLIGKTKTRLRYAAFDLPETLCCSSYFLMKSFPEKRFLLYGEGEPDWNAHDFILLPSFTMKSLPDKAVDLFLNRSSLGEMKPDAARMFVAEIARTSKSFWHANHETRRNRFEDGSQSLLNGEYPIPADWRLTAHAKDPWSVLHLVDPDAWDLSWYYWRSES